MIHADIDPAEISKNRAADVPIVGDAREVIVELTKALQAEHANDHFGDYEGWRRTVRRVEGHLPRRLRRPAGRHADAADG